MTTDAEGTIHPVTQAPPFATCCKHWCHQSLSQSQGRTFAGSVSRPVLNGLEAEKDINHQRRTGTSLSSEDEENTLQCHVQR